MGDLSPFIQGALRSGKIIFPEKVGDYLLQEIGVLAFFQKGGGPPSLGKEYGASEDKLAYRQAVEQLKLVLEGPRIERIKEARAALAQAKAQNALGLLLFGDSDHSAPI